MDRKVEMDATQPDAVAKRIVYVKPIPVAELPQDMQDQVMGAEEVYAVHSETGERLALVRNKNLAFMLARQNDMAPVHVH